jgi:hypothetical protein
MMPTTKTALMGRFPKVESYSIDSKSLHQKTKKDLLQDVAAKIQQGKYQRHSRIPKLYAQVQTMLEICLLHKSAFAESILQPLDTTCSI